MGSDINEASGVATSLPALESEDKCLRFDDADPDEGEREDVDAEPCVDDDDTDISDSVRVTARCAVL